MRGWKQRDVFWQGKKAEIVLILFLTSGFAAFIFLWLLVLPISNNYINHVLLLIFEFFSHIINFSQLTLSKLIICDHNHLLFL